MESTTVGAGEISNWHINAWAAINYSKLAGGTNHSLLKFNGSGVLAEYDGIKGDASSNLILETSSLVYIGKDIVYNNQEADFDSFQKTTTWDASATTLYVFVINICRYLIFC